ncbi:hypothetical protein [uncultured Flavobacterium sp.]|uniref:hypothetical protein n=1 Tax=uncultured Flavobacterium sp. TaxID=165435 RepID=UPI0025CDAF9F|nr:hypothetical protein [uncultured Flavobacterium sp.]
MVNFSPDVLRHSAQWTTAEEACSTITGFPNTIVLDVNEGYEVLHFVCRYMALRGWFAEAIFQGIESAIKTRLPFGVRTHKDVKDWLDSNYRR